MESPSALLRGIPNISLLLNHSVVSYVHSANEKFLAEGEPLSLEKKEPEPTVWFSFLASSQLGNQQRKNIQAGGSTKHTGPTPVLWGWFLNVHFKHVSLRSTKNKITSSKTGNFFYYKKKNDSFYFWWFSLPGL